MRGVRNPELKAECVRLRVEERLSLREIQAETGAPKGSLSAWLREFPLTEEERRERQSRARRYTAPKKVRGTPSPLRQLAQGSLTRHRKAKVAETAALLRMVLFGFEVYGSPFDGDKIDWVVETPKSPHPLRVQVRFAKETHTGLPTVSLTCSNGRRKHRRYTNKEFDFIVGYDLYTDTCYVWSWDDVANHTTCATIAPEAAERWDKLMPDSSGGRAPA